MATELKPIRTKADYKNALAEVERLWGAKGGTAKGDRLDVLATLIDAYEAKHYPMRYAGANNFVGRPLRGYQAAECVVKREVGALLKSVQDELAPQNLSLKMFDCYRPTRAVADMVAWSRDGRETPAQKRYNPAFSKPDLFRLGYIATHSGHSTGAALDLSLVDLKADNSAVFDAARDYGDCTANVSLRAPDGSVDMFSRI